MKRTKKALIAEEITALVTASVTASVTVTVTESVTELVTARCEEKSLKALVDI